jgi:anti-sigma regulatory factor (Ser/Thr protein kinase)
LLDVVPAQNRYSATLDCNPDALQRARKGLAAFAGRWLTGTDATDFESAVGEALANVIKHAECSHLTIKCRFVKRQVVAEIEHDGRGFDLPQTITAPALGSVGGYGLYIMRTVLDRLEYRRRGRHVLMAKRTARAPSAAARRYTGERIGR